MIKAREFLWELVEDVTGARLTISYGRVGGVKADLPDGFEPKVQQGLRGDARGAGGGAHPPHRQPHLHGPHGRRRRALARGRPSRGVSPGRCCARPACPSTCAGPARTGPTTGWSSRSPLGKNGDNFDRYLVRMAEMEQSMRIAEQALEQHARRARSTSTAEGTADRPRVAYVDRGKQGKTEGLLLLPITLSPNLQGQDRRRARPRQRPGQARGAAAEGDHLRLDRRPDEPLHAGDGRLRHPAARGRGVLRRGGGQRRARLLRGLRRQRPALPRALPAARACRRSPRCPR